MMKYTIDLVRTSHRTTTVCVHAETLEQAQSAALAMAGDIEFPPENDAEYEVAGIRAPQTLRFYEIVWDTDGESVDLPREVVLAAEDELDPSLEGADILSNLTGWCVSSFKYEVLSSPMVVFSLSEGGFWSNDLGWTDLANATLFAPAEIQTLSLPMASGNDAKYIVEPKIDENDIERVLSDYALRVTDAKGRSFRHMAEELFLEIDLNRVAVDAAAAGNDPSAKRQATHNTIREILVEMGVLEF